MSRGAFVLVVLVGLAVAAAGVAASVALEAPSDAPVTAVPDAPFTAEDLALAASAEPLAMPRHVRAIIAGGGPTPELDQVSLEDDLALAVDVLGADESVVLFAGGPGTRAVQVRDDASDGDPVVFALANLFSPRNGRDARYRPTRLRLHGSTTSDEILGAFEAALPDGDAPLLFYFTGHGSEGKTERESVAQAWGGTSFDPPMLAEALEASATHRQVRVVISTCYSGGFAELAFDDADVSRGATSQDRCGIFATAWDRESGGCDSDPDRAVHEGFGVHFLSALRGQERDGTDARAAIDLDHDGAITLLEALAHTRIASRAIDVPITTSERLLRATAPTEGASTGDAMPEDRAVIDAITASLRFTSPSDVAAALAALETRAGELDGALDDAFGDAEDLAALVAGIVLSRWPVLDDPYHPDYAAMLAHDHEALADFFETSEEVGAWAEAEDEAQALLTTRNALEVQIAVHRRLAQALETTQLAGRLRAVGGEGWARYERMRACEATVP
jgi:hypothetical protein